MIVFYVWALAVVTGSSEQEELDNEIVEAEQAYLKLDGTSESVYAYINELEDVYDLMDDDSVVTINDVSYTKSELKTYINSEYTQAKNLEHQENLNESAAECEEILGNATTISQYESYQSCLEDLYDEMYSTDTVTLNDEECTKSEVNEEIEKTEKKIEKMENKEKLQEKIEKVEKLTYEAQDSDDYSELKDAYEEVLEEMENQEYEESETVEINNEDMTMEDIEDKVAYLDKKVDGLEREEKIEQCIGNYEELEDKLVDVYGNVYTTSGLLEDEISELKKVEDLMLDTEMVEISDESYTKGDVGDLIDSLKSLKKDLSENDEVRVLEGNEYILITEDEYEYRMKISKKVEKVQTYTNNDNEDSENLKNLSDALFDLLDSMDEDKSVVIDGDSYTFTQIETWANETKEDSESLEKQEKVSKEVNSLNEIYEGLGQYASKSEVSQLYVHWKQLLKIINKGDEVEVYNKNYTYTEVQENVANYNKYKDLQPGKIYKVDQDLNFKLVDTPKVQKSSGLTSEEFLDFIEASSLYDGEDVIIASNSYSDAMLVGETEISIEKNERVQMTTYFLQDASSETEDKGEDFHYGDTRFIIVTSFIEDESGTGKLFLIPEDDPSDYFELIEGLDEPIGVCVDVNHNYLYIVDRGYNVTGSIIQYFIELSKDNLTIVSDTAYEIYSGTPTDCKIDSYGNLYFTDSDSQSLNKILYSDLLYHYADSYTALYSSDTINTYPVALDIYKDKTIFFSGNNENGTLTSADTKGQGVRVLASEKNETCGVGISQKQVFYSLDTPEIKVWDMEEEETQTFHSTGLISPKRICTGQGNIYVVDYDAGILYKGETDKSESLSSYVYIQAGYACFCVNLKESSSYSSIVFISFLITYLL